MTLFEYLESMYVKSNIEVQMEFSLLKQAEANAAQKLIGYQRGMFTLYAYLKLIVGYILVKLGLRKPPLSGKEQVKVMTDLQKGSSIDSKGSTSPSKLSVVPNPSVMPTRAPEATTTLPVANELKD